MNCLSIEMTRAAYDHYVKDKKASYIDEATGEVRKRIVPGLRTKEKLIEYVNQSFGLLGTVTEIIITD